ncbi:succinoglycan transporter [Roseibium denhamense]|uniref:Uncharacterized protein involved in exopolysaccharide biosynthesis n=1 Tax=Roseibium denhamense TaxID=76305 RepID=A0ABY1NVQ9_9HYPH|nr:exopolysaccharide transport family protein [Roseibium denhamense]MTI04839.1 succinoglycan transporter [Roseibium denhamense]SMP18920.1 Uncharacterized protein involved in exopolysaccharide biosynthesis [Roseibium denhamense]
MNAGRQTTPDDDLALDLGGLIRAILRSLGWLLPLTLFVAVGVFFGLQLMAPKYLGETRVLIESTDNKFPGASRGAEEERAVLDNEGVASQVQLLMSADLARRVARKLELARVPEFGARGQGGLVSRLMSLAGVGGSSAGNTEEERVLKHYYENLDIYRLDESRVIAVDYSAEDPLLAAEVANTIVDEYLAVQSAAKRETTELASSALEPQIEELRKEVQSARKAVADFRARADLLVGADNIPLNQQQLAETSSNYSAAQADKAEAQAKADLIRELLDSGGSLETASDVLNSQLIQRLREQQVAIQSNIAELSITLLPNHPQLKALQSQLSDYNRQIRSEARKILEGLENDAKVANQQALALETSLNELKTAAAKSNADQARLSELEREADAKADQLDQLLASFREADSRLRAQVLPADARIVSRASVPVEPSSPKVIASTIVAALATLVLGIAFVIMREFLSGNALHPMSAMQPERRYDTKPGNGNADPSLNASWPQGYGNSYAAYTFDGLRANASEPQPESALNSSRAEEPLDMDLPEKPETAEPIPSELAEDLRPSHDDLDQDMVEREAFSAAAAPTHEEDVDAIGRIVVLSVDDETLSHEMAFGLARRAAGQGRSTLIMEVFPEQSNKQAAEGFSDVVAGRAPFAKVVYRDAGSKAHIIEAGRITISDGMVDADRFKKALDAIRSTYETVVVDLGAIDGSLASARMLSFADRVLIAASAPDNSHELESAANLLAHNTGARVEVVIAGGEGPGPRRNDDGHAA